MNRATKAVVINSQEAKGRGFLALLFHSTPVLDRSRRNHWVSGGSAFRGSSRRFNNFSKRIINPNAKQTLLRNVSSFAEHVFQSWQYDHDEYDPSSSEGSSWFRRDNWAGRFKEGNDNKGPQFGSRRDFQFCGDDFEDRLALGLSASGPLDLDDVKNAYRACALKWHPDRHLGSSKVVAEEKFKACSAAYKSLCDKLALS